MIELGAICAPAAYIGHILTAGGVSRTPGDPVTLRERPGEPGRYDAHSGCHRLADAWRRGGGSVPAVVLPATYAAAGPFFDFGSQPGGSDSYSSINCTAL